MVTLPVPTGYNALHVCLDMSPLAPCLSISLYVSHTRLPLTSSQGQRWHLGSEPFGRPWQSGDVVGCMIDLTENTIIFTLNGEVLVSDSGSGNSLPRYRGGDGEAASGGPSLVFLPSHLTLHTASSPRSSIPSFHAILPMAAPALHPRILTPAHLSSPHQASCLCTLGTWPGGSPEPGPGRELPAVLCHLWPPREGFEPFAINMQRPVTTWFSKGLPQF